MQTPTTQCPWCFGHGTTGQVDEVQFVCSNCHGSGEVTPITWPTAHECRHLGVAFVVETESFAHGVAWTAEYLGEERSGTARDVEEALRDAREWVQIEAMAVAS